jgi:hypothetical protein
MLPSAALSRTKSMASLSLQKIKMNEKRSKKENAKTNEMMLRNVTCALTKSSK